jgi:hypothetical protein
MKLARAYGVGVVLTTQNPVDIDYKGLTNAGTWFIGKLQTERDKARVLDGLESAASEAGSVLDRRTLDKIISALGSRVFLLHNVHEDQPIIFNTRWAMSYLRGPLTRSQVRTLMTPVKQQEAPAPERTRTISSSVAASTPTVVPAPTRTAGAIPSTPEGYSSAPPALSPGLPQVYLPLRLSPNRALALLEEEMKQRLQAKESHLVYEPALVALGRVSFVDRRRGVNETRSLGKLVFPNDISTIIRWQDADSLDIDPQDLESQPGADAYFSSVPEALNSIRELKAYAKDFGDYLYHEQRLQLLYNPTLKLYSKVGESERDFRIRLQQAAREKRDDEVEKMRRKYRTKLDRLEKRLKREERELAEDEAEYEARKREEMISGAETVIGLLGIFGRRRSRGLSTAATKHRLTSRAKADIEESHEEIARIQAEIEDLRQTIQDEAEEITQRWAETLDNVEPYLVKPRRVDIQVDTVALGWLPYWEISYTSPRGRTNVDRVPAWQ